MQVRSFLPGSLASAAGLALLSVAALTPAPSAQIWGGGALNNPNITFQGGFKKWQYVTMRLKSNINTSETHATNPFLDYRLNVTFAHAASSTVYVVPGFYAADSNAEITSATSGKYWKVMFTPDHTGTWTWSVSFRTAAGIAVDPSITGTAVTGNNINGSAGDFLVTDIPIDAEGFFPSGRLEHVGGHYLVFAETAYPFLKNAAGGPENFLGFEGFDGTFSVNESSCGGDPPCFSPPQTHEYPTHDDDWLGDAIDVAGLWGMPGSERGHAILGAVNYLASKGVNGFYFVTYNVDCGDGKDVWPWADRTDKLRYDCSKLEQWNKLFTHMTHRGLQLEFIFEEAENDQELGAGSSPIPVARRLYYREMIARFGHNLALEWILGEESNHSDADLTAYAAYIRGVDPYDHPIGFHTMHPPPSILTQYSAHLSDPNLEVAAIQTTPQAYNMNTVDVWNAQVSTEKWALFGDEQSLNAESANLSRNRNLALWGNLMAGGAGVAWWPGNGTCSNNDLGLEDFRVMEDYWEQGQIALDFFYTYLPWTEMIPSNTLASPSCHLNSCSINQQDYVFALPGEVYAVVRGGTDTVSIVPTLDLGSSTSDFSVQWYDPRLGGILQDGTVTTITGPGAQSIGLPPTLGVDWVALVREL